MSADFLSIILSKSLLFYKFFVDLLDNLSNTKTLKRKSMKKIFTLFLFVMSVLVLKAADITFTGDYTWDGSGFASEGDKIVVAGQILTIDYPAAPHVSIEIQNGGVCVINQISNMTGYSIEIQAGGELRIEPTGDITIGQNIIVRGFQIPTELTDIYVISLLPDLSKLDFSTGNLILAGNDEIVTFAGDITVEPTGLIDVQYPAENTSSSIVYAGGLFFKAALIPKEFVPLIKGFLPDDLKVYEDYLEPGIIPPGVKYPSGANLPPMNSMDLSLEVLKVNLSLNMFRGTIEAYFEITLPDNGVYIAKEANLGALSRRAPDTYNTTTPLSIKVPVADQYTVVFPEISTTGDQYIWYLLDSEDAEVKVDMSLADPADRTYTVNLPLGETSGRFSFVREPRTATGNDPVNADNREVVSVEYFTITGVKIQRPIEGGMYIERTTYDTGAVESKKMFFNQK